jgi:hypothetical protein
MYAFGTPCASPGRPRRAVRLTRRGSFPIYRPTSGKSFRFRSYACDEIPAFVTPLDSALTKREACKPFRICSYENCRVAVPLCQEIPSSITGHWTQITSSQLRATLFGRLN